MDKTITEIPEKTKKKFTTDWFSSNTKRFDAYLHQFKNKNYLNFLEIGSFEGRSTCWLLDNILTGDECKITCIDTFEGGYEHHNTDIELESLYDLFLNNVKEYGDKVIPVKEKSNIALLRPDIRDTKYDFIYIDGCHESKEVLEDAVLCWELLNEKGIMIFDDYGWGNNIEDVTMKPKVAIESFINCYRKKLEILQVDYQVVLFKK
jgi:predicted O-methyltransferase YrrM